MREEYKNILNKMVVNECVINESTDGRRLLMYLQKHGVLRYQDKEELVQMGPTKCIEHLMKIVLQSRNDGALIHFLNSLKEANFDEAYSWLKGKLDSPDSGKSDNPDSAILWKSDQTNNTLKTAGDNLKIHYEERSEFVESNWRQFGVIGILKMDTFYNHNIVICNEKYKQIQKKVENFDNLFATGYKRIIVMAEAGYGKSTFVHEMARQWVQGDKDWTRKFAFLFLFRLAEVNENESKSLEMLLTACFLANDATKVYNCLKDGNMSKALFIFDGLDELRQNFCQEISEIIFGGKVNLATVVITSRQCQKLANIKKDMQPKLYVDLKGFTDEGVFQQLKKFSIPVDGMKEVLKNHLKIPLFNTIYCITRSESSLGCTNICSSIHGFVNFAINRYRNSNQSFTISCREELLLTLGQAAQNKFLFIQDVEYPYPNVSRDHLFWAVESGLLHASSLMDDLVFAHQTIAEYCAAYFWCVTSRLVIKHCNKSVVEFTEPSNGRLNFTEPFTQFLYLLRPKFKEDLWRKFHWYVPIFDEYKNIPILGEHENLSDTPRRLCFSSHSVDDQITIMNKLRFQENRELDLNNGQFEPEKPFKTIRKLKKLHLNHCTFNIGPEEFFIHYANLQSLKLYDCKFYNSNIVYKDLDSDESNASHPPRLPLQELQIGQCSDGIETLLSFVMKNSTFMKSFKLLACSFHDCGSGWISELQNNKHLCISIETCVLWFPNKLKKLEANAVADFLEFGLFGIRNIKLNIKMENQEDYEPILKNLSKLSTLTSLRLLDEPFTTGILNYLADIFNKLKLEECGLEYQEILFDERIINSINSCSSLKKITFWMCCTKKMEHSNYELFKKRIGNNDTQLKIEEWYYWK